jgi:hypothetical protein
MQSKPQLRGHSGFLVEEKELQFCWQQFFLSVILHCDERKASLLVANYPLDSNPPSEYI